MYIMIFCKICNCEFKSVISNSHLKQHNVTSDEYKAQYGSKSLASDEYRLKLSVRRRGENNPNYGKNHTEETKQKISKKKMGQIGRKGPLSEENLKNLRMSIKRREEKYNNGEFIRPPKTYSTESRKKISESIKEYAKNNPEEMKERAALAIKTKRKNGPIISPMKGKHHSENAKLKMTEGRNRGIQKKTAISHEKIMNRIQELGLILLNDLNEKSLNLKCTKCESNFFFTKQYFTDSKFKTTLCPTCYPREIYRSMGEIELYEFIKTLYPTAIANDRSTLNKLEIDVLLKELNIGFEFSGLYWHSELSNISMGREKEFDLYKQNLAKKHGIQLYIIFEDEWKYNRDIVESRIRNILNCSTIKRIYARKCTIHEITSVTANKFLKEHHLQGSGRSNIRYGLYHDNELVSVMTFSNNNISRKIYGWEINRFCSLRNFNIIGGASKLLKRFITDKTPTKIISYADSRWSNGELYKILGFKLASRTPPNYWYFKPNEGIRKHRYALRKNENDNPDLTEYENRAKEGYMRIWDCGSTKWVWEQL